MTDVQDIQFAVSLFDCKEGDCVKLEITGAQAATFVLTPQQARAFASDLIQTVYRAEVKNSLQKKQATPGRAPEKMDARLYVKAHPA